MGLCSLDPELVISELIIVTVESVALRPESDCMNLRTESALTRALFLSSWLVCSGNSCKSASRDTDFHGKTTSVRELQRSAFLDRVSHKRAERLDARPRGLALQRIVPKALICR